mmetsp:Transcript_68346/g.146236  ORF Transcript_68346/g.146236 Transcript_68346/m.146236 type:complete len:209 (+) Transcript_68346:1927-2553(+)
MRAVAWPALPSPPTLRTACDNTSPPPLRALAGANASSKASTTASAEAPLPRICTSQCTKVLSSSAVTSASSTPCAAAAHATASLRDSQASASFELRPGRKGTVNLAREAGKAATPRTRLACKQWSASEKRSSKSTGGREPRRIPFFGEHGSVDFCKVPEGRLPARDRHQRHSPNNTALKSNTPPVQATTPTLVVTHGGHSSSLVTAAG